MTAKRLNDLTPDQGNRQADRIIRWTLILIWCALALFGIFTWMQPAWLKTWAEPGRKNEAQTLVNAGKELMYRSNVSGPAGGIPMAVEKFKKAIAIDSTLVDAWASLGVAYLFSNRLEEARLVFEKCLQLDTVNRYYFYSCLGDYHYRKQENDQALRYFLLTAQTHPQPEYALRKAGLLCLKSDSLDQALMYLQWSVNSESSFDSAYRSAWKTAQLAALTESDTTEARLIRIREMQTHAAEDMKRLDRTTFEKANMHNKGLAYAHLYLGDVFMAMKDSLQANRHYQLSVELHPPFQKMVSEKLAGKWNKPTESGPPFENKTPDL